MISFSGLELVGRDYRAAVGTIFMMGWAAGYMFLPALAYVINDHVHLQIAMAALESLTLLTIWYIHIEGELSIYALDCRICLKMMTTKSTLSMNMFYIDVVLICDIRVQNEKYNSWSVNERGGVYLRII